jgi:NADH:ubiquinone oxidoreductase subunit 2 (subunit N)
VVISIYYYFGIVRAIYWSRNVTELSPINVSWPMKISVVACVTGIFYLGLFPGALVNVAVEATKILRH